MFQKKFLNAINISHMKCFSRQNLDILLCFINSYFLGNEKKKLRVTIKIHIFIQKLIRLSYSLALHLIFCDFRPRLFPPVHLPFLIAIVLFFVATLTVVKLFAGFLRLALLAATAG